MRTNMILLLILKDWRLHRHVMIFSIVAGALALGILQIGGEKPLVFGAAFFYISMAFCACILPMSNIVNERKKQTLPFLMGLPVSAARYGAAKLISTLGMFLLPWLTLIAAALYVILGRHVLPHGAIPVTLILANLPLIGFCLITGTALVAESEGWGVAAIAIVNSSYWIVWYLLVSDAPSLTRTWAGPVAVWNRDVVNILGAEFAVTLLILGPTLYLQARKRNFL
jgi:hypothetical protein